MEQEGWYNFEKPLSERIAETVENYGIMDGSMAVAVRESTFLRRSVGEEMSAYENEAPAV